MAQESTFSPQYQQTLSYYKDKVDALEQQRQAWLSKFNECGSQLKNKHDKLANLNSLKNQVDERRKDIIHHQIAELDEKISSLNLDRQNQALEFEEAEQLVKMRELVEENPIVLEKQLPCLSSILSSELIQNDLNIHTQTRPKNGPPSKNTTKNNQTKDQYTKTKITKSESSAPKSLQHLLKLKLIQSRKLNEQEIELLKQQKELLKQKINQFKAEQSNKVNSQRNVVKEFKKKYQQLQKNHKNLAQAYFQFRRNHKKKFEQSESENKILKEKYSAFEKKVEQQIKVYEKENKAKQALILRKSEDFKQNYKAKMRAKERNLQSLKENYQKMQEICIEKVRKLQAALERAENQLRDSQESRKFVVEELREELKNLEKKSSEQMLQKARIDLKIKRKLEQERALEQVRKQREQKAQRELQKEQLIKSAYKKTRLPSAKGKRKPIKGSGNKKITNNAQQSDDDSLNMSDLQKLQKQINIVQKKVDETH